MKSNKTQLLVVFAAGLLVGGMAMGISGAGAAATPAEGERAPERTMAEVVHGTDEMATGGPACAACREGVPVALAEAEGFWKGVFDTRDFPARWHCGNWSARLGWLTIGSDTAVWGAYMAIPVIMSYFMLRRKDVLFPRVYWLFIAFIFSCGTVHLVEAGIFWWPVYRVSAVVKFITAVVSWATVAAMVPVVPAALALPGLAKVNKQLEMEVAERRRAETRAEEKNRQLEQFVYSASHDLKAPLVTIMGYLGHLRASAGRGELDQIEPAAEKIQRAAVRMKSSVEDLLELSRIGRLDEMMEEVSLSQVAGGVAEELGPQLAEHGVKLEIQADMPSIKGVRERIFQLLENLVSNAMKYGCDGPASSVEIGAVRQDGEVRLFVRDHGQGIPAEQHERVFQLFHRLDKHRDQDGTGVGLAIVRRVAELHGGKAWVESSPGQGATFWASFADVKAT